MNRFWSYRLGENEPWCKADELRSLFFKLKAAFIAAAVFAMTGWLFYVAGATRHQATVLVAGDGRVYGGVPGEFNISADQFKILAADTIEAGFFRTEVGNIDQIADARAWAALKLEATTRNLSPPEDLPVNRRSLLLEAYIHPSVVQKMGEGFQDGASRPFYQAFRVQETRIESAVPTMVEVHVRGLITSRDLDRQSTNEVFVAALFRPVPQSVRNPLGWRLEGLLKMTADQFYAKERDEKIKAATKTSPPVRK